MISKLNLFACLMLPAALTACGGGGGNGSNGGDSSDGSYLRLLPSSNVSTYEGESTRFTITGTSSRNFNVQPQIAIIETTGAITTELGIAQNAVTSYEMTMTTSPNLPVGEQSIKLTVRVCEDNPQVCHKPFPGSPWQVTQKVLVKPRAEGAKRLGLNPEKIDLNAYPGESVAFGIRATGTGFNARGFESVVDPLNFVEQVGSTIDGREHLQPDFTVRMQTRADLPPGEYTTNVQVHLCAEPDTVNCKTPFAGSPWLVPVKFTVKSNTNLSSLPTLAQVGAWSTFDGNAGHNAYVAASFNPANFARRWSVPTRELSVASSSVAVDNGRVFHVHSPVFGYYELRAIREDSGQVEWRVDLGKLSQANAPAAGNGRVYLTSTGDADSFYWVFEQATGKLLSKLPMSSQRSTYLAPTIYGTDVYTASGSSGGMSKFDGIGHALAWERPMQQVEYWTPAVDANFAYVFMNGSLLARPTGSDSSGQFNVASPDGGYGAAVPTLSGKQMAYVVVNNTLQAFDLAKRERMWSAPHILGRAVVAKDVVYALRGITSSTNVQETVLEARSADKGELLWMSEPLESGHWNMQFDQLLVTDNIAFVSSRETTLAVDLAKRRAVWQDRQGGALAMSNRGVLYILNKTEKGALGAVNLQ
jgi:DNA-binding beta-propeller fold protein YncE